MPYLHCGLGESLQPGLEGLVVPLFNAGAANFVLRFCQLAIELAGSWYHHMRASPARVVSNNRHLIVRIAISMGPRGVNLQVARRISGRVKQAYLW